MGEVRDTSFLDEKDLSAPRIHFPHLKILIRSAHYFRTESVLDNMFDETKLNRYKYDTDIDDKLLVFRSLEWAHDINIAILVINLAYAVENEASIEEKIWEFIKEIPVNEKNNKIPIVIHFVSKSSDIKTEEKMKLSTINKRKLLEESNRFIYFSFGVDNNSSYKMSLERIISIGIVLSETFDIKTFLATSSTFVLEKALVQQYQANGGNERGRNILHLIAKMNLTWTFDKIVNDFPAETIVKLLDKQDLRRKQTPPMMAALYSQKDILAAFMNFYASKIGFSELYLRNCKNRKAKSMEKVCHRKCNICIVKRLLHRKDEDDRTLTSYIVTANEKSLSAMGIVLQFEHDFHIRSKKKLLNKDEDDRKECEDEDYLELQACLQKNVGTSSHSDQVLNLMENTRTPSRTSIWLKIAIAVLTVHLLQFGLHVGDIASDANVAKNYFTNSKNDSTNAPNASFDSSLSKDEEKNTTLQDYPNALPYQSRFIYTLFSMIAPIIFYFIEMWRHYGVDIWRDNFKTHTCLLLALICVSILLSPILAVFWPLIIFVWRIFPLANYELSGCGEKQQEYKKKLEKISEMALVVQLFEVCLESSFQAILQWYEIFPTFISRLHEILNSNGDDNPMVVSIQTNSISFIFSIISLVWSFTSYSAAQKNGVLDITRNLLARSILFLSNLFLIFSRVNSLVLFMYYCGKGQFYPGMIWVLGHILIMMVVHLNTLHDSGKLTFAREKTDYQEKLAGVYGRKWQSMSSKVDGKGDQSERTEKNELASSQSWNLWF